MTRGVFVTGTDTGVGKTVVSAILTVAWRATYWKPLQTGLDAEPGDSATVARLGGLSPERIIPPAYALRAPLSPLAAAKQEEVLLNPGRLVLPVLADPSMPLVVEGAGGVLVPVWEDLTMIDVMVRFALPVLVVARSSLGTINHSLLTLEALRRRGLDVLGMVFNGTPNSDNVDTIEQLGNVRTFFTLTPQQDITPNRILTLAETIPRWRQIPSAAGD